MWLEASTALAGGGERSGHLHAVVRRETEGNPLPLIGRSVKRLVDVVLATVCLVLSLPVLLVVALAVRRDSAGPALFKQVRVGADGRPFTLFKFRSMVHGNNDAEHRRYVTRFIRGSAERNDGLFKLVDDPRITRVGRVLRQTSLDELPQLWNVLRGEMSLIGPRPPLPAEVAQYSDEAWQRLRVKPGLTGLWQVSGRSNLSFDEMVALDVRYWQQWSPLLDLTILLKTPKTVLTGAGTA